MWTFSIEMRKRKLYFQTEISFLIFPLVSRTVFFFGIGKKLELMAHSTVTDITSRDHFTNFSFNSSKGNDVFGRFISYIVPKETPL